MSLYLHFPFCKRKCDYCDFNSYRNLEDLFRPYAKALMIEMERNLPKEYRIRSVYFGGGTPSYLPVEILAGLLEFIKGRFQLNPDTEITLEANPGTVSGPDLGVLRSSGFNRLSIGLQATQDRLLQSIGRIHSWTEFLNIFYTARAAGFSNIGVDLIFGLPGQTAKDWEESLEKVTGLNPEHISAYGLQLEPGTKLAARIAKGLVELPAEEIVARMMGLTMRYLPEKGFQHYEISNYAKPGFFSIHNLSYWQGKDYLGCGAGAYSTINGERRFNVKGPEEYIKRISEGDSAIAGREKLDNRTAANEALLLGLRLRSGINLLEYQAKYGIDLTRTVEPYLKMFLEQNLIKRDGSSLALTEAGVMISNYVISSLLSG